MQGLGECPVFGGTTPAAIRQHRFRVFGDWSLTRTQDDDQRNRVTIVGRTVCGTELKGAWRPSAWHAGHEDREPDVLVQAESVREAGQERAHQHRPSKEGKPNPRREDLIDDRWSRG